MLAEEKVLSLLSRKHRSVRSVGKAERLFFVSSIDLPPQSGAVLPANGGGVKSWMAGCRSDGWAKDD